MTMTTTNDGAPVPSQNYHDKKRYFWLLSSLWVLFPALSVAVTYFTGIEIFTWSTFALWYLAIPVMDKVLGQDTSNPPEISIQRLENDNYYRYLAYATVPLHYVTLIAGAWAVATLGMSWVGYLGIALSVGLINGIAINTGHELGHKKSRVAKTLAKLSLATTGYGHFMVEHNKGHHKDVATPEDPASSRFGESIYRFALREIPGAMKRSWQNEKERLGRQGKSPWSTENEMLQPMAVTVVLYGGMVAAFGAVVIPFLLIAMAYGYWFLTMANYVEHYGLLRQKQADGRFERCRPEHSWNTNHTMSNLVLFHLQRHSDHHAYPTRSYQSLRHFQDLPTLPSGYPGMFTLAMFPPLWRAVMDPRVLALYGQDIRRVNLDPKNRDKILRRYAGARTDGSTSSSV